MSKWEFALTDKKQDLYDGLVNILSHSALKAAEDDGIRTIEMRCVPYGEKGPHWRGTVQFQAGAFKASLDALKSGEEVSFIQGDGHYSDTLGMVASSRDADVRARGTVKYEDKEDGLYATVVLADTQAGRDVYELVDSGVIDSCSVGVYIEKYSAERNEEEAEDVTITAAILDETSFVDRPRFSNAKVKIASEDEPENVTTTFAPITARVKYEASGLEAKVDRLIALLDQKVSSEADETASSRWASLVATDHKEVD